MRLGAGILIDRARPCHRVKRFGAPEREGIDGLAVISQLPQHHSEEEMPLPFLAR